MRKAPKNLDIWLEGKGQAMRSFDPNGVHITEPGVSETAQPLSATPGNGVQPISTL